jgi:hypothetical protein
MKLLFEGWRQFVSEQAEIIDFPGPKSRDGVKEFSLNLDQVNAAMKRITDAAKKVLGAEGEEPYLTAEDFLEGEEELRMVAEGVPLTPEEEEEEAERLGVDIEHYRQASPEQLKLRRQYYGPEGELEKTKLKRSERGLSQRKGTPLEKGLGRMTAADFETAGVVMPVSIEVLDGFRDLVEETKTIGNIYEEARDWYHHIRGLMDRETESDRDATLLGLMIATYSPRAKFALNLAEAVFMYKAVQKDVSEGKEDLLRGYIHSFPKKKKGDKGSLRGFTKAHKVPNFALNLIAPNLAGERDEFGEVVYNDMYEWNSTIDTWMIDAFYPFLRKASSSDEWSKLKGKLMSDVVSYRYMARLVASEARKLKILPHELQAIIWVASQIRQTGQASLGVTTQFAFDQIRQSIKNVASIRDDLQALKDLEEKDWLGTIISTIDRDSLEDAARYLLEPNKGVRSITSRGKKGDAFKYFPIPPKKKIKEHIDKEGRAYTVKNRGKKSEKRTYYDPDDYETWYMDPQFADLSTWYVLNSVIQMNTGKFSNLHDSILLYLDPEFSTDTAVQYILGRFDPDAKKPGKYFLKEIEKIAEELRRAR